MHRFIRALYQVPSEGTMGFYSRAPFKGTLRGTLKGTLKGYIKGGFLVGL